MADHSHIEWTDASWNRHRHPTEAELFLASYARVPDAELERLAAECVGPLGQLRARVLEARRLQRRAA